MEKSTIVNNPVDLDIYISKLSAESWQVTPALKAFPLPIRVAPKNIIFLIDNSGSMQVRLQKVKNAVSNLLDKLNPNDTFSVVSFNDTASVWVKYTHASKNTIVLAKKKIMSMSASSGTNFKNAFIAVNSRELMPAGSNTSIIFLTDGEDHNCSAKGLFQPFRKNKSLRIIPIGILESRNTLLDQLASISGGADRALYITSDSSTEYQNAFDLAFKRATEQSQAPVRLEMRIEAGDDANVTVFDVSRTLNCVVYDGSVLQNSLYFNSPIPPQTLRLSFNCEDRLLQIRRKITPEERRELEQGKQLHLNFSAFKWKNNSTYSWILALGNMAVGLALLAGVSLFVLSFPQLSLALWQPLALAAVAALIGLFLLICGVLAVVGKTILLPSTSSATVQEQNKIQNSTQAASRSSFGFFARVLAGSVVAGCGASGGYYAGTQAFATSAVMSTGISPFVFITGCAVGTAIALPMLVYGCVQSGLHPLTEASSFSLG